MECASSGTTVYSEFCQSNDGMRAQSRKIRVRSQVYRKRSAIFVALLILRSCRVMCIYKLVVFILCITVAYFLVDLL